ncbi:MAG TPA: hypothetical protein VG796_22550 [Verrucomicrobiales bacterium]|jgi:hypothetical protein|nr:hypothetical protein [Verrucomicrobiales bacterium]
MNARVLLLFVSVAAFPVFAQEPAKDAPAAKETAKAAPTQEELEAKFKTTLTQAVMKGRWCMLKNGEMGADKDEKYTISGVEKTADGKWTITARIQYGAANFAVPVPVTVKWAGDTPVIIVDNLGFPGTGKYSARVMIYGNTYAGTWSGGDHGGLLHGVIVKEAPAEKPAEKGPEKPAESK